MATRLIKPKKLKIGDTIGLVGTSSFANPDYIQAGSDYLRQEGFKVLVHPQGYKKDRGSAGTTQEKIDALQDFFRDPTIDAIFSIRGGSRALHMLDGLDYALIQQNPKIFAGYSDVTVLLSALSACAHIPTFHANTATDYGRVESHETNRRTLRFLKGAWQDLFADYTLDVIKEGSVEGRLFGGNLSMLTALLAAGDAYIPSLDGAILVIEDVGEEMRSIDRMLGAMRLRGVFDRIAGLVIGYMTDMRATDFIPFDRSITEIVSEHTAAFKGPIVMNAPHGHAHPNLPFPLGVKARLTAEKDGLGRLELCESPFSDA